MRNKDLGGNAKLLVDEGLIIGVHFAKKTKKLELR